jgi:hypothetical protein
MAISTQRLTETCTRTREAAGTRLKAPAITPRATQVPTLRPLAVMGDKKRVAGLQPLVEARVVGNPDKRAPAVPRVAAVAVVGESEGNAHRSDRNDVNFNDRLR